MPKHGRFLALPIMLLGILFGASCESTPCESTPAGRHVSRCDFARDHGYLDVEGTNGRGTRAWNYLCEMREKTNYTRRVSLYASPFDEAWSWNQNPCGGPNEDLIVIHLQILNEWDDDALRGLVGHEFGHRLTARHENVLAKPDETVDEQRERDQVEADGYSVELVGERAFLAFARKSGWDARGARDRMRIGTEALKALRQRAPLT